MKKVYKAVHLKFLKKNIKGRHFAEMTPLFNKRFKLKLSDTAMKDLLVRNHISNGRGRGIPQMHRRKYSEKHFAYLRKIVPGTPYKLVLEKFNKRFGFDISIPALRTLCKKHSIKNGFLGYFPKGHVPANKGKKGYCVPGSEKGWFKKGQLPLNWRPVGSERITVDGYVEIKVSDVKSRSPAVRQKNWRMKHVVVWEKANGPVPKGHIIIFLDGNRLNITLKNLFMVSREVHAVMCHLDMYTKDREITRANCLMANIKMTAANLKRKSINSIKNKKMIFQDNDGYKVYVIQDKNRYIPVRETRYGALERLRSKKLKSRATRGEAQRDLKDYAARMSWMRI